MTFLLKPIELLYRGVNRARRALYRAGVLRAKRLPKPVISVGNIAIGGSGKTPAVIAIARALVDEGLEVAILTRGYGRTGEGGRVDSFDAARFGDEPLVIHKAVPNANVIVGSKRHENGSRENCDVYLLDDGFQHLQLHRDLDVVIDAPHARWYREGRSALRDADVILQRKLQPSGYESLVGRRVFAFSGLADNEQFFAMLRTLGIDVVATRSFADHYRYTPADVEEIKRAAAA
ncbi:MAG TPA: tetraacyldisaccharide 4'-kinase, partial [Thermoanaerobaculia bacterium]|nr:tetraacyldisaccharide 4'-kinase [Thermoanaerobaculia bacterium]